MPGRCAGERHSSSIHWADEQSARDSQADELAQVAAENPHHHIWRETTYDDTRYCAKGHDLSTHPHTLVTKTVAELRAALSVPGR